MSNFPKVFCIGLWKTGTKSFGHAMQMLGFSTHCHYWPKGEEVLDGFIDTNLEQEDVEAIKNVISSHNAFADSPWMCIYKWIESNYPEAKFVLSLRKNAEQIAISEYYHALKNGSSKEDIKHPKHFIDRYNKHNEEVRSYFKDKPGKLLEICWETDGWGKLPEFVGLLPPFPHSNKGTYRK